MAQKKEAPWQGRGEPSSPTLRKFVGKPSFARTSSMGKLFVWRSVLSDSFRVGVKGSLPTSQDRPWVVVASPLAYGPEGDPETQVFLRRPLFSGGGGSDCRAAPRLPFPGNSENALRRIAFVIKEVRAILIFSLGLLAVASPARYLATLLSASLALGSGAHRGAPQSSREPS